MTTIIQIHYIAAYADLNRVRHIFQGRKVWEPADGEVYSWVFRSIELTQKLNTFRTVPKIEYTQRILLLKQVLDVLVENNESEILTLMYMMEEKKTSDHVAKFIGFIMDRMSSVHPLLAEDSNGCF